MNTWLWSLGQNTITVALMLPFVLLACRLFRNRPAVQHVLWLVVLLKFLTQPIVSWPWTVEQMGEAVWTMSASAEQAAAPLPSPERSGHSNVTRIPEIPSDPSLGTASVVADPTASTIAKPSEPGDTPISEPQTTGTFFPIQAIAGVWLLGVIVCGVLQLRCIARHAAFVRRGATAPVQLTTEIKAAANRLGMRPPRAVLARGIMSPFVWCLGYLRLVWPESLGNATAIARSRGIIAHELAHVRRCDHWVAWLELVAGIIWWWNPLYWYVRRRLRETAEMACDALAIATNPENRREYAEMLLELSADFKNGAPAPVLAVGAGTPSSFERRLTMILSHRVSGKMSSFGILAAIGFALVALPGWSLGQPPAAEAPVKVPQKQEKEDAYTAWGTEVGGLQAGLGFRPGEHRAYHAGETVKLVVRVRNVGKKEVKFEYCKEFFYESPPAVTDGKGKPIPLEGDGNRGFARVLEVNLAPGREVNLCEMNLKIRPATENGKERPVWTLYGTEKFQFQYESVGGNIGAGGLSLDPPLSKLATGKLELEVRDAEKLPEKKEKEDFTAWGKEVGGLQAGLGFRDGEKRAYSHGETVPLVVRVRNVGKEAVKLQYLRQFFIENPPVVTYPQGERVPLADAVALGEHGPLEANLAPGKEIELYELKLRLRPKSDATRTTLPNPDGLPSLYGTGKFQIQYERVFGNSSSGQIKLDPALSKLATGKLELEIKSDPPPATEKQKALPETKVLVEKSMTNDGVIEEISDKTIQFDDGRVIATDAATKYVRLSDKGEKPTEREELRGGLRVRYELMSGKAATKVVILTADVDLDNDLDKPQPPPPVTQRKNIDKAPVDLDNDEYPDVLFFHDKNKLKPKSLEVNNDRHPDVLIFQGKNKQPILLTPDVLKLLADQVSHGVNKKPGQDKGGAASMGSSVSSTVSLTLCKASAQRNTNGMLFRCEVQLDNATGRNLVVQTKYSSAFDGLEVVVTTQEGKLLAQQSYTVNQLPSNPPAGPQMLKGGATTHTLEFLVRDLPGSTNVFKVRLVGTLPGSAYERILTTETIEVKVHVVLPGTDKKADGDKNPVEKAVPNVPSQVDPYVPPKDKEKTPDDPMKKGTTNAPSGGAEKRLWTEVGVKAEMVSAVRRARKDLGGG